MKRKPLVMALLGLGFGMMTSVQAADKTDRIAQLEAQLKALQEEVAALKKSSRLKSPKSRIKSPRRARKRW